MFKVIAAFIQWISSLTIGVTAFAVGIICMVLCIVTFPFTIVAGTIQYIFTKKMSNFKWLWSALMAPTHGLFKLGKFVQSL